MNPLTLRFYDGHRITTQLLDMCLMKGALYSLS